MGDDTAITLNGGSIGNTVSTPAATSINRNIIVEGAGGGVNVALHPLTWAGNISGAGRFVKSGDGELELTGTNTYSGGTLIRARLAAGRLGRQAWRSRCWHHAG